MGVERRSGGEAHRGGGAGGERRAGGERHVVSSLYPKKIHSTQGSEGPRLVVCGVFKLSHITLQSS